MTITNCTISGNSAVATGDLTVDAGSGGGISNGGDLQITSSTIAHNSASGDNGVGGGINGFEPTRTDSSIIALNSASTGDLTTSQMAGNSSRPAITSLVTMLTLSLIRNLQIKLVRPPLQSIRSWGLWPITGGQL